MVVPALILARSLYKAVTAGKRHAVLSRSNSNNRNNQKDKGRLRVEPQAACRHKLQSVRVFGSHVSDRPCDVRRNRQDLRRENTGKSRVLQEAGRSKTMELNFSQLPSFRCTRTRNLLLALVSLQPREPRNGAAGATANSMAPA